MDAIEPKILPLVNALNSTGILNTFSSCEGHFERHEQEMQDRNFADVRFEPRAGVSVNEIEKFLTYLVTEFHNEHGFAPIEVNASRYYTPILDKDYQPEAFFMIEIKPFDRFDPPAKKRVEVDNAIEALLPIVYNYKI